MAGLLLPNVSYATAVDLGDKTSPYVSVHPRRKQELCRRLALQALKMQYGMAAVVASGPEFASVAVAGSALTIKYKAGTAGSPRRCRHASLIAAPPSFPSALEPRGEMVCKHLTAPPRHWSTGTLHRAETADSPGGCAASPFEVSVTAGAFCRCISVHVPLPFCLWSTAFPCGSTALSTPFLVVLQESGCRPTSPSSGRPWR